MTTKQFSILVVDDEPPMQKVLYTSLSACGFRVETTSSGEQAVDMIGCRPSDLVLLDINLPGARGIDACHQIRALVPDIGIIMITVRDAENDIVQALEAGADDYVTKPFRFRELVARLRSVQRRKKSETTPEQRVLSAGDLEMDLDHRFVRRAGQQIHLTPTEFQMLAILMQNPGTLVPHGKLLRAIWGPEYGDDREYLRSYVRSLRKKIEDNPANPKYILTEPWIGYRFQDPTTSNSG